MQQQQAFDIAPYINMAIRRKYWIIIPFLFTILGGMVYLLKTPKIYQAQTLILVESQEVPKDFVRPIVESDVEDRLKTITQQVTSRTNLERIIQDFNLFDSSATSLTVEEQVGSLRKNIEIDVNTGRGRGRLSGVGSFTIAFQGENPKKVMEVTNALASNFITENLKIRESQALGTSAFLADELESVKGRLAQKEEELKQYREKYMGGLPEQLDSNLRILERLQEQVDQLSSNLRDAQNRKILLQQTMEEAKKNKSVVLPVTGSISEEPRDLAILKNQLAALEAKYTEKHPDVIRLRKTIESLEGGEAAGKGEASKGKKEPLSRAELAVMEETRDLELEVANLKSELTKIKEQIKEYQRRVEETPKREQELYSLKRDYENLQELYNSILNRKLEAEIAVSMEKKQKGEQFRVVDPAKIPSRPVKPDARKITMIVLALGLALGGGLAYLMEMLDTTYKTPEEVEKDMDLPVLVSIPFRYTQKELKIQRLKKTLAALSVVLGFVLSAIGILLTIQGVDTTIGYVKKLLAAL